MKHKNACREISQADVIEHKINNSVCALIFHANALSGDPQYKQAADDILDTIFELKSQVTQLAALAKFSSMEKPATSTNRT